MSSNDEGFYRRPPRQRRSKELVRAIREAAMKIVHEEGEGALTTTRIAEVAGVGIGSLYEYFPNKEAILGLVHAETQREESELYLSLMEKLEGHSLEERVRRLFLKKVERHRDHLSKTPLFYRQTRGNVSEEDGGAQTDEPGVSELWLREQLALEYPGSSTEAVERAAFIIARGFSGLVRTTIAERPHYIFDDIFIEEIMHLVISQMRRLA